MAQTINATQARDSFSDIVNRVTYGNEEFIVERQGKPVVLITQITKTKQVDNKISPKIFLSRLSKYSLKSAPVDLAQNHDKYTSGKQEKIQKNTPQPNS